MEEQIFDQIMVGHAFYSTIQTVQLREKLIESLISWTILCIVNLFIPCKKALRKQTKCFHVKFE